MKLNANELIKLLLIKEGFTQKELTVLISNKTGKKLFINILILVILLFIADFACFCSQAKIYGLYPYFKSYIQNLTKKTDFETPYIGYFTKRNNSPYKDNGKPPLIFSGCSFMYGVGLEEKQTLPFLISKIMKRPVVNIAIPSCGLSQLIFLTEKGILNKEKNKISSLAPDVLLYNYADFHIYRIIMQNVFIEQDLILYKNQKGNLVLKKPPFIITRSALLSIINSKIFEYLSQNSKLYVKYLQKLLKMHFLKEKNDLEKLYPNIKFVILVYFYSPIFEGIANDLKNSGIYILRMNEDFHIDTNEEKYLLEDGHPSALVWEESAHLIAGRVENLIN